MSHLMRIDGAPAFLLGVNYWSRAGGPRMWERFDEAAVRRELRQMRAVGLNVCRSFCFLPTFVPHPPAVEEQALGRLGRFLTLCHEEGLGTLPTFLVGHMSGENYDFPGQAGRSLYTDAELLAWQRALVRAVSNAAARQPAVVAYLVSNEMPLWAGGAAPATIRSWAGELRAALEGPSRPFGLGDGVMNLQGGQNGFDPCALRDVVDFVGPHTYYADTDPLRQAVNVELCVRSLTHLGLPVLLEELGCSSTQASEEGQRLYYREAIHACLSAGAAGALGWCYSDLDLVDERPYRFQGFELGFGITRADGTEKPVCQELRDISRLIERIDLARLRPPRPQAAIVIPSYFNKAYPFSFECHARMRRTLLQAYALCAAADVEVELVPEEALELQRYRLVLAPATQKLLSPTWQALLDWVRAGNTLYWSYHAGDSPSLHGAWCHLIDRLTGCRHGLRYGCLDLPDDQLLIRGSGLDVRVPTTLEDPVSRSFLPIEPGRASVLARDGRGRPALVRAPHGPGRVVFLNHPLERHLAGRPDATARSGAHRLYRLIAREAGLDRTARADDPGVQLRLVEQDGAPPLLWIFNHTWDPVSAAIDVPEAESLHGTGVALADGRQTLALEPKQVAVFRVRG